jgi:aryl-alcohol dehydrogenase-like predicted oxidoreductase
LHSSGKSEVAENEQCCAIPGTSSLAHLEENMGGENISLSDEDFAALAA